MSARIEETERRVARIDDPVATAGNMPGHRARRLIEGSDPAFTDPFLLMAEDWMPHGAFSIHPHRGIETVTYVISGLLDHFDNSGHRGQIGPGDAQWMTAGRGVLHEENPPPGATAHTLQLWINLPAAEKMTAPGYQELRADSLPEWLGAGARVTIFSGECNGVSVDTRNHVPVTMLDVTVQPGETLKLDLPGDRNAFLHLLTGQAMVGPESTVVTAGQLAWLSYPDRSETTHLTLRTGDQPLRLLLFAGKPLREPVIFGGPFVMTTTEDIKQAYRDFARGTF